MLDCYRWGELLVKIQTVSEHHSHKMTASWLATQAAAQATAWGFKNVKPEPWAPGSPAGAS